MDVGIKQERISAVLSTMRTVTRRRALVWNIHYPIDLWG